MIASVIPPTDASSAYQTVDAIVSRGGASRAVSVSRTIASYRAACPESRLADEELVRLIVRAAIGRTRAVHFDGNGAAPPLPFG